MTGELRTWHSNGELKERRHRENRKWVGLHEKFYSDGSRRMVGHWDRGSRHGTWKWYHPNGKSRLEVPYDHDNIDGSVRLWRDDGDLVLKLEVNRGVPDRDWLVRLKHIAEVDYLEWEPGIVVFDADRRPVAEVRMTGVPRRPRRWPLDFVAANTPWWSTQSGWRRLLLEGLWIPVFLLQLHESGDFAPL